MKKVPQKSLRFYVRSAHKKIQSPLSDWIF